MEYERFQVNSFKLPYLVCITSIKIANVNLNFSHEMGSHALVQLKINL